ncbi:MAG: hypothetical protein ACFFAE_13160 [Candidatus Hodarchaeota archaeon]
MTSFPVSSILSTIQHIPIIPVEEITDTFTPATYGPWDYYVIPPDTDFTKVEYWGTSTDLVWYTGVATDNFAWNQIGTNLIRGNLIPFNWEDELFQNTSRDSQHDFFDPIPYPRAVRIDNEKNPVFNQTLTKPLSLHINYSSTFFAKGWVEYWGYVESDNPFYLDVGFSAANVMGWLEFESAYPEEYIVGIPENKMTYPIFPVNDGIQKFTLMTNDSTLVTLTPHSWDYPTYIPQLNLSTLITGELSQGSPWLKNETTDQLIEPENDIFSIRMFELSLVKGKYYRISSFFDMEDVKPGVPSYEPIRFLVGENYRKISGSIDQDGLVISARESETVTLVLFSPGEANGQYFIFYQEEPSVTMLETSELVFDTDITLEYDIYYTFTIGTPIMMRTNWTAAFEYDIYRNDSKTADWIKISNENFIDDTSWKYIPPGDYALEVTAFNVGEKIRFNTVAIQTPTDGPFSVNNETLLAIELPLTRGRVNWVNLSTTDQINQTITYDIDITSKYEEDFFDRFSDQYTLGNQENNGIWEAWPGETNNSLIDFESGSGITDWILPTREYEVPILIISPISSYNGTHTLTSFSGTLNVMTSIANDESTTARAITGLGGSDFFIPKDTISSTTTFLINNATSSEQNLALCIPLNLAQYKIYNISVFLIGNTSTNLNATVTDIDVHGGNLNLLSIFSWDVQGANETMSWSTELILTVSDISYLFIDLWRYDLPFPDDYANFTLLVSIEDISAPNLAFNIEEKAEYNPTVNENLEVFAEGLIANEIIPPEMRNETTTTTTPFPFELLLIAGGVVVGGAAIATAIIFIRRKRSSY